MKRGEEELPGGRRLGCQAQIDGRQVTSEPCSIEGGVSGDEAREKTPKCSTMKNQLWCVHRLEFKRKCGCDGTSGVTLKGGASCFRRRVERLIRHYRPDRVNDSWTFCD